MAEYPIRIVGGNWFRLIQPLEKIEWQDSEQTVTDYEPSPNDDIKVTLIGSYSKCEMKMSNPKIVDGNKLQYENNGTVALGVYGVEVKIVCASGARLRSYQDNIVKIVKTNKEASIPDYKEFGIDTFQIGGAVFMYVPTGEGGGGGDMSNYYTKAESDAKYLQTETDPTIAEWAKQSEKPTYTAQDVGALPADTPIPSEVTEQTVSGWGFTKNTGNYNKPSNGIPKTDLASDVQTSLGKADSALQSQAQADWDETDSTKLSFIKNKPTIPSGGGGEANVIEKVKVNHVALSVDTSDKSVDIDSIPASIVADDSTHRFVSDTDKSNWNSKTSNVGTITGITMNGASKGTSGVVDLGTVVTDVSAKEDKVVVGTAQSSSFIASVGNYYKVTTTSNITITLSTPSETSKLSSCIFLIDNTSGGVTFTTQDSKDLYSSANWTIDTGKIYEVNALYNGTAWYLTQVEMEAVS